MYQQIAIKPCPVRMSSRSNSTSTCSDAGNGGSPTALNSRGSLDVSSSSRSSYSSACSSSIIRTSKNWVLPPRPKPGRKSSVPHKRKSISTSASASAMGSTAKKVIKKKDLLFDREKSKSVSSACTTRSEKSSAPLVMKNLDDCTSIFLKFEDDENVAQSASTEAAAATAAAATVTVSASPSVSTKPSTAIEYTESELANIISTSVSQSLVNTDDTLLSQSIEQKITNTDVSSLLSSSTGTPNSIFSSDHYILSNSESSTSSGLLTLSTLDTDIDLDINDDSKLNFKLLEQDISSAPDFLPINFSTAFDSEYISPTLEELMDDQERK